MTCTVGYFAVENKKNAGNSYCALEINVSFFVRTVYRVRKTCQGPLILNNLDPSTHGFLLSHRITDDVATWVSYGTSLIVLVCSWLSHDVAI